MGIQASQFNFASAEINLATDGNLPSLASLGLDELKFTEAGLNDHLVKIGQDIQSGKASAVSLGRGRFSILEKAEVLSIQAEREARTPISAVDVLDPKLKSEFLLFSSLGSRELAQNVASHLGIKLGTLNYEQFKDGELSLSIKENIRDKDAFLISPTSKPINEQLIELFISIDALKRASARKITVLMPYFGYARQDKQLKGREPISCKLFAKLLKEAGADRIVSLELHSDQSVGFFDIAVENLRASSVLIPHLKQKFKADNLVVVSPDEGGIKRASKYAEKLDANLAVIHKQRKGANQVKDMIVLGDVEGKDCLIVDDMIDTGGTLMKAAEKLKQAGARSIYACCVHAVLSADAVDKLRQSQIEQLITTDSIPLNRARTDKIEVVSIAPLLAEGIKRLMSRGSIRELEQTYL